MNATDYKTLSSGDSGTLAVEVRGHLNKGWCLLGGPVCPQAGWFGQAIYMPEETTTEALSIAYVEGKSIGDLTIKVEMQLEEGWKPVGGLTVHQGDVPPRYIQMMSRPPKKTEEGKNNE